MPLVTGGGDPVARGEQTTSGDEGPRLVLDARETVRAITADLAAGTGAPRVAARFHATLAAATVAAVAEIARHRGLPRAVLSGGAFQNRLLLEAVAAGLEREGLEVLLPTRVPPNDGGIAYGQAAVAAARLAAGGEA
jgi:hydrogenase maturation protein HypF